jgi:hypothetical protein
MRNEKPTCECGALLDDNNTYAGHGTICRECYKRNANEYRAKTASPDLKREHAARERRRRAEDPTAKDKDAEKFRKKYAANPQKHIARNATWQKENRLWRRTYQKARLDGDPRYAIERRLRGRLWHALRGSIKAASTFDLVGCSPSELMRHIESQFVKGMNWDNRTEWHIDHIRPCDSYDMGKESQQRECFHYTNLQPIWRSDNLRKGKKYVRK